MASGYDRVVSPAARRIVISYCDCYYDVIDSPLGPVFIGGSRGGLHRVEFLDDGRDEASRVALLERESGDAPARHPTAAAPAVEQLREHLKAGVQQITLVPYRFDMAQIELIAAAILPATESATSRSRAMSTCR